MAQDYNKTLNLPNTSFPMRAGLPQSEPKTLKEWEDARIYEKLIAGNAGKPLYVLHDGPPYANGDIHLGTAMNKVLKDIIVRYKNMAGFLSPYVPGWDTHGLPTELKARAKAGVENSTTISPTTLRALCREFALGYLDDQRSQFKRLGVLGEWDHPYITLNPAYEAKQIELFGEMAFSGTIYRGLRPVYWCSDCETALAEAEIEYSEDPCYSIYVKFAVHDDKGVLRQHGIDPAKTSIVIWTTTAWTLPGNVAIAVGPDFDYSVVEVGGEYLIVAKALCERVFGLLGEENPQSLLDIKGSDMEYMTAVHPFLDRDSLVIVGDHVTLESGTGAVHTAPGHGVDDYEVCKKYKELPIIVPVDSKGRMTREAGVDFEGLTTEEAGRAIAKALTSSGALLATEKLIHDYPHCWRCKSPVLFRATEQWFCSVEQFREKALEAIKKVEWLPAWGEDRIASMVRDRADWCISRQRKWGVPIPILYCKECGKPIVTPETIAQIAGIFREQGSDSWYARETADFVPGGLTCPDCGGRSFDKENDIMDVWFDSGVSHAAVCAEREDLTWPADLYLEGADQYRGWFQSSLLTSVAWRNAAPYKGVLTHGWVVDGKGEKMSKSLGNGILASEIVEKYGADILRLWVSSSDYRVDVRISPDILNQISEAYRKIRNTARFILGNLGDFQPDADCTPLPQLLSIDRWALLRLNAMIDTVKSAYDAFEFHRVAHALQNFCVVDLSNFYLDVLKDRLYIEKAESAARRSAQTAMYLILDAMTRMLTPILAYTADEIWRAMPHRQTDEPAAAVLNAFPGSIALDTDEEFMQKWERIHALREDVQKALELARTQKVIGAPLDACVTLHCEGELFEFVSTVAEELPAVFITSKVVVKEGAGGGMTGEMPGLSITVEKAPGEKCARCWTYAESVGELPEHPALCTRCAAIMNG